MMFANANADGPPPLVGQPVLEMLAPTPGIDRCCAVQQSVHMRSPTAQIAFADGALALDGHDVEARVAATDPISSAVQGRTAERKFSTTTRIGGAIGLLGASALLDRSADRWATRHGHSGPIRLLRGVGDNAPVALAALVASDALFRTDEPDGAVAWESVKASVATAAIVEATKIAVDRSRPSFDRGASDFGHEKRADSSFPSFHTAVAWSAVTPFAERYDAPWLYGVAALTNFSRVAGRDHWLSDTVAGGLIGWWMGDFFHRQGLATDSRSNVATIVVPGGVVVMATFR